MEPRGHKDAAVLTQIPTIEDAWIKASIKQKLKLVDKNSFHLAPLKTLVLTLSQLMPRLTSTRLLLLKLQKKSNHGELDLRPISLKIQSILLLPKLSKKPSIKHGQQRKLPIKPISLHSKRQLATMLLTVMLDAKRTSKMISSNGPKPDIPPARLLINSKQLNAERKSKSSLMRSLPRFLVLRTTTKP